jgi:hypothetical protein
MSINWFVLTPGVEGIAFPTYGEYGGPNYTGGEVVPPGGTRDFTAIPVDTLDAYFKAHDLVYAESTDPLTLAKADLALIDQILAEDELSGESSLYGGVAALTLLYQIVNVHKHPEVLAGRDVEDIADDALDLIGEGSIEPDAGELAGLQTWLAGAASVLGTVDDALVLETADKVLDVVGDLEVEPETAQAALDLLLDAAQAKLEEAVPAVDLSDHFDALEELLNSGTETAQAPQSSYFML